MRRRDHRPDGGARLGMLLVVALLRWAALSACADSSDRTVGPRDGGHAAAGLTGVQDVANVVPRRPAGRNGHRDLYESGGWSRGGFP